MQTKQQIAATEQEVDRSREALSAAVAEQRSLEGGARSTAENVETYAQVHWACCCFDHAPKQMFDQACLLHSPRHSYPSGSLIEATALDVEVCFCASQRASALEAELRAAKERVDLAQVHICNHPPQREREHTRTDPNTIADIRNSSTFQVAHCTAMLKAACQYRSAQTALHCQRQARKEELWELAKEEGSRGDLKSDHHYVKNVAGGCCTLAVYDFSPSRTLCNRMQYATAQHRSCDVSN